MDLPVSGEALRVVASKVKCSEDALPNKDRHPRHCTNRYSRCFNPRACKNGLVTRVGCFHGDKQGKSDRGRAKDQHIELQVSSPAEYCSQKALLAFTRMPTRGC
jgi:hypothetical protein